MRTDFRSVSEIIEDLKKQYPTASRVYLFYVIDGVCSFKKFKLYLDEYTVVETDINKNNIIKCVKNRFNDLLSQNIKYKPEDVHCERYSLQNNFREQYLLLNNGAYERSGLIEDIEEMYKPAKEKSNWKL